MSAVGQGYASAENEKQTETPEPVRFKVGDAVEMRATFYDGDGEETIDSTDVWPIMVVSQPPVYLKHANGEFATYPAEDIVCTWFYEGQVQTSVFPAAILRRAE